MNEVYRVTIEGPGWKVDVSNNHTPDDERAGDGELGFVIGDAMCMASCRVPGGMRSCFQALAQSIEDELGNAIHTAQSRKALSDLHSAIDRAVHVIE